MARAITGPDQRWVLPYSIAARGDPAAQRRRDRPLVVRAGRAGGRDRHRVDRRARVHRPRPPPEDRPAVSDRAPASACASAARR